MPRAWGDFVERRCGAYDELAARCDRVAVVGLSVGGGLTALIAEERPNVAGCVFINPMLKGPGAELETALRDMIDSGLETLETGSESDIKKPGASEAKYEGWPLRSLQSVIDGVEVVGAHLSAITAPSLLLSSREDHTVAPDNGDEIVTKLLGSRRARLARGVVSRRDARQRPGARRAFHARVPGEGLGVMASLSREDVAHVAKLARLTMSDAELDMFTAQLSQVLDHASDMNALDLEGVVATAHPFGLINVVRDDEVRPCLDHDAVMAMAPDAEDGRFAVPRILGRRREERSSKRRSTCNAATRARRAVLEESLARIRARNDELHVFLYVDEEGARARGDRARRARRARRGRRRPRGRARRPQGQPVSDGILRRPVRRRILEGWRPAVQRDGGRPPARRRRGPGRQDEPRRVRDGFVDRELGLRTRRAIPWTPSRVPGGSSGGSAAAVAADMTPLALGSDTGGSIRQPAALCGLVGVKPTYGLVSRYGLIAFASSLDQIGPLTKTVADAAMALEVIAGHDPLDSTSLPEPSPSLVAHVEDGVAGKRIGVVRELIDGADDEVVAAVGRAVEVLRDAGATIVELSVPEFRLGLSAYYLIAPAEASSNLARFDGVRYGLRVKADDVTAMMEATRTAGFGEEVKRRIMLGTYALSAGYYDAYYGQALKVRTLTIDAFRRAYEQADLLLGATTPSVAFEFGTKTADPMAMYLSDVFTIPSNLSGEPGDLGALRHR